MDENLQDKSDFSVLDLIKLLISKLHILLLVVILGGILGGSYAVWKTKNVDYYGTTLEFYINPKTQADDGDDPKYDVYGAYGEYIVKTTVNLLKSQVFAEILMEGMDGAPQKNADGSYSAGYKSYVSRIQQATDFYYLTDTENTKTNTVTYYSFIYVRISVLNDEAFATKLLQRIKEEVPEYVETNVLPPNSNFQATNCQNMTPLNTVTLLNPGYTKTQAIKYAFLLAAVSGVVACIVLILLDRADKRLRDTESLQEKFNVPVLGIVPSIDEIGTVAHNERDTEAKK